MGDTSRFADENDCCSNELARDIAVEAPSLSRPDEAGPLGLSETVPRDTPFEIG